MKKLFPTLGLLLAAFVMSNEADAQVYTYDFGTGTGSHTSGFTTSFLPAPPAGGGTARVRVGSGGGGFYLENPGNTAVGTGTELRMQAPTGGSVNKFSIYGFSNSGPYVTVKMNAYLDATNAQTGEQQFFIGSGATFSDNNTFNSAQMFTGFQMVLNADNTVTVNYRSSTGWNTLGFLLKQENYLIEVYGNNDLAATPAASYTRCGIAYTVGAGKVDVWVNGTQVGDELNKGALAAGTSPDSFMSISLNASSPTFSAILDDITYSGSLISTAAVTATATGTNPTTASGTDGSATVSVTTGTAPYTYSWTNGGGTAATATGLSAGTYIVTVTDAAGCQISETVTLTDPAAAPLSVALASQTNASCFGASDGSATVTASGGTAPYTYSWTNGGGSAATASNLAAGTYTVTVTDNASATATETVTITEPAAVVVSASGNQTICAGSTATLTASGADSYVWTPGGLTGASVSVTPASTTTYTVTGTTSGCSATATATVTVVPYPVLTTSPDQTICAGSSATLTATGATAYIWMPVGQPGASVTVTPAITTTYTVAGTDNGCTSTASTTVTVTPAPMVTASSNTPVANGGTITLSATGGGTYTWSGPNGFSSNLQNPQIGNATAAAAGTYTVSVTDNGCSAMATTMVTVSPPAGTSALTVDKNQPATATNFVSFADLAAYLNTTGVTMPTVVNVIANSGPYTNEQLVLNTIPGSSATNTVTINGNGNTLDLCSNTFGTRDIIHLNGTDNVTIDGFVLNATCGYGWGVHLLNGNDNVTISNNTINLSAAYSIYGSNMQGIIAGNSPADPSGMASPMSDITITGNTINNGYNGIRINGNSASRTEGLTISDNTLNNTVMFGIFASYANDAAVDENMVDMKNVSATQDRNSMGMYLVYVENGLSVQRNRIINAGNHGMFLNYINQTSTTRGTVANNMVGGGLRIDYLAVAIQLNFASYLDVYYNSTNADYGNPGIGLYIGNAHSRYLRMVNNSFAYTGSGAEGRALHANDAHTNFLELDYNNYYSTGGRFVYFNRGFRTDLAAMQAANANGVVAHDANSMSVNPMYVSSTDLHLQAASMLKNNAQPLASVTVDYDNQTRPALPTIGADEIVGSARLANASKLNVNVYPNPFSAGFTVNVTGLEGQVQLQLVDMMGRQVYTSAFDASAAVKEVTPQVKISEGVYLLQVTNNGNTSQFRVVKQ